MPTPQRKFRASLALRYAPRRQAQIQALCDDAARLEATPVHRFVDLLGM